MFEDTRSRGKPIVFFFGSRPFTGGMCEGLEQVLATMKAGGKRQVVRLMAFHVPFGFRSAAREDSCTRLL